MEIELGHTTGLDHARSIHQALLLSLEVIRHWAEKIPGFSELNKDDQNHLLETAFLQLFVARLGYRYLLESSKFLHRQFLYCFGDSKCKKNT